MTFFGSLWRRIVSRRPREAIELNPVEQLALRYLLRAGERTADGVTREVNGTRVVVGSEAGDGLAHLIESGLVEARTSEGGETVYAATGKAARLRDRIPLEPRGVTEFYL